MSYIGRGLQSGAFRQLDDISSGFDGSDTTHTMQVNSTNVTVGDVNQILLSLGGVIQKPGTDFTVSSSTLTFTTAPAANTSFFAILLGSDNGGTVTPTDNSVTASKISSNLGGDIVFNEDSNDHDFRIEGNGDANAFFLDAEVDRIYLGNNTTQTINGLESKLQIVGAGFDDASMSIVRYTNDANGPTLQFAKSKNATIGSHTISSDGDEIGKIKFTSSDGSNFDQDAVTISAFVDGTPGSGSDMPGGLAFKTTADGSATPTERMRIHSGGVVSIPAGVEIGSALDATAANTLDDYEEGSFSVEVADAGSGGNSNAMTHSGEVDGVYTKIGSIVFYSIAGTIDTTGLTGTNILYLRGLPFTANNKANFYEGMTPRIAGGNYIDLASVATQAHSTVPASQTYVQFYQSGDAAGVTGIAVNQFVDDASIRFQGMYQTDS
jgi:hypothetical protein